MEVRGTIGVVRWTLGKVRVIILEVRGTLGEVRGTIGVVRWTLKEVWVTLGEVRHGSVDPRGGPGWV